MEIPKLDIKDLTPLILRQNANMMLSMIQQTGKQNTEHEKLYFKVILELVNYVVRLTDWQTRPIYNPINMKDIRSNQWIYFNYIDEQGNVSKMLGRTFSTEEKSIPNNIACCGFELNALNETFTSHLSFPNDGMSKIKLLTIN